MYIDINQLINFTYYHFGLYYIYSYILFLLIILFNVSFCLNQYWQWFVNFASLFQKLILTLLNLLFLTFILLISFLIFIIFFFHLCLVIFSYSDSFTRAFNQFISYVSVSFISFFFQCSSIFFFGIFKKNFLSSFIALFLSFNLYVMDMSIKNHKRTYVKSTLLEIIRNVLQGDLI